MDNPIN